MRDRPSISRFPILRTRMLRATAARFRWPERRAWIISWSQPACGEVRSSGASSRPLREPRSSSRVRLDRSRSRGERRAWSCSRAASASRPFEPWSDAMTRSSVLLAAHPPPYAGGAPFLDEFQRGRRRPLCLPAHDDATLRFSECVDRERRRVGRTMAERSRRRKRPLLRCRAGTLREGAVDYRPWAWTRTGSGPGFPTTDRSAPGRSPTVTMPRVSAARLTAPGAPPPVCPRPARARGAAGAPRGRRARATNDRFRARRPARSSRPARPRPRAA